MVAGYLWAGAAVTAGTRKDSGMRTHTRVGELEGSRYILCMVAGYLWERAARREVVLKTNEKGMKNK